MYALPVAAVELNALAKQYDFDFGSTKQPTSRITSYASSPVNALVANAFPALRSAAQPDALCSCEATEVMTEVQLLCAVQLRSRMRVSSVALRSACKKPLEEERRRESGTQAAT